MGNSFFENWAQQQGMMVSAETSLARTPDDHAQYVLVDLVDEQSGGQALFLVGQDQRPQLLDLDNVIDLSAWGIDPPTRVTLFSAYAFRGPKPPLFDPGLSGAQRLHVAALHYVQKLDSSHAPGTGGGNLACAWAVNYIAQVALGHPVGGDLATRGMFKALKADGRWQRLNGQETLNGDLVISPTGGIDHPSSQTGHVGFVSSDGLVRSNSSGQAMWIQNYTKGSWAEKYADIGMAYFRCIG